MKKQTLQRTAKGLYTSQNPHTLPEGALVEANNVFIDYEGKISKARGFAQYGAALSNAPSQLIEYGDTLIAHDGTSLNRWVSASTWTAYTGTFSAPTGHRIRATRQRKNLYFTTSGFPQRLDSATGTPFRAGAPAVWSIENYSWVGSGGVWFAETKFVGYRAVYGKVDANGRVILGRPSPPLVIENDQGSKQALHLKIFYDTDAIGDDDRIYLYRTEQASTLASVGAVYKLVTEEAPTAYGTSLIFDYTPDDLLGPDGLYTNPTQEGDAQENRRPPVAHDISTYKGYTLYSNVRAPHSVSFRCMDASSIADGDQITVKKGASSRVYTATTTTPSSFEFSIESGGTAAQNARDTMLNLVSEANIYCASGSDPWSFRYEYDPDEDRGRVIIEAQDDEDEVIYVYGDGSNFDVAFDPVMGSTEANTKIFSVAEAGANKVAISKYQEPDAVPPGSYFEAGEQEDAVLRSMTLRDSAVILKEDGTWVLSGDTAVDFAVRPLDTSIILTAPDTAVVLNNAVYCDSTLGVVRIDEAFGASIISMPIEEDLRPLRLMSNWATVAFGVAYESQYQYWLWVPTSSTDTYAKKAYVYNYVTKTWTTRERDAKCGIVMSRDEKLYLGHGSQKWVSQERKALSGMSDFTEESITLNTTAVSATTDSDGDTVSLLTIDTSGAGVFEIPAAGWIYEYGSEEALIVSVEQTGSDEYQITLSKEMTSIPSATGAKVGFFDILALLGVYSAGGDTVPFACEIFKPVISKVQWAPDGAGNLSTTKQFVFAQVDFEESLVSQHELAFSSNYVPTEEELTIRQPGWGTGDWDNPSWSTTPSYPLRTMVPRQHQRGQWLNTKYTHRRGRERFDIVGLSLVFRPVGERTSRKP